MVFRVSIGILALLVIAGVVAPDAFGVLSQRVQAQTLASAGWLYLLVVFCVLAFLGFLAFGRMGALRIGGSDAEPEFSRRSWFAMLFSAGMGIGLVFWGAAEPLSHLANPPEGVEGGTAAAARAGMRYAFFHWGLHPWAIYALMGLALAWARYNRGGHGRISDLLRPLLGARVDGLAGRLVNLFAVVATAIGVATTLGLGATQIGAGLEHAAGIRSGFGVQLAVIGVAFVLYMVSSASGLDRGIKWLSNFNIAAAAILLACVVILGPTGFIFETLTTTLGGYLNQLPSMSLRMTPFSQMTWVGEWTIFYWAWWIAWAPFVGAFFARISYGRTVREFVFGVVFGPALVSFLWFSAFGGTALFQQLFGGADLLAALADGYEHVLFASLAGLPLADLLAWTAIVLLLTFFVTSADSATLVLATMSNEGPGEPPMSRRIAWGVMQAAIAVSLLAAGGLQALQAVVIVAALPFAILLAAVLFSLYRELSQDRDAVEREERELLRAERRWLRRERERDGDVRE